MLVFPIYLITLTILTILTFYLFLALLLCLGSLGLLTIFTHKTNTYSLIHNFKTGPARSKNGNLNTYCYLPRLRELQGPNAVIALERGRVGRRRGKKAMRRWGKQKYERVQGGQDEGTGKRGDHETPTLFIGRVLGQVRLYKER